MAAQPSLAVVSGSKTPHRQATRLGPPKSEARGCRGRALMHRCSSALGVGCCMALRGPSLTWQNMWQGGKAMSLSAAGFQAVSTSRRSFGLVLILWMSSASCGQCG